MRYSIKACGRWCKCIRYIVTIKTYTSFAVNVNVQISAKSSFDEIIILSNKNVTPPHPRPIKIINLPL